MSWAEYHYNGDQSFDKSKLLEKVKSEINFTPCKTFVLIQPRDGECSDAQ